VDPAGYEEEEEMSESNGSRKALESEVAGLREQVVELTSRLRALEGDIDGGNGTNGDGKATSRRDLLRLAGALAAGAAGTLVLRPVTAAAATNGNMILGQANDADAPTKLSPSAASAPTSLFEVIGQNPPTIPSNPSTHTNNGNPATITNITVPVLLAVSPFGVFPQSGNPAAAVYPGVAPVQGIGGPVVEGSGISEIHVSEGVDGFAGVDVADTKAVGAGVVGSSDYGIGVVGSGGTDIAAFGTGYFAQAAITDANGILTAGPPPQPVYNFEQARDKDGALWLSTASQVAGEEWRRMNTFITINPFRIYDSRPNARPANSTTNIQIAGVNGIPSDAIGVFGNLTVINPSANGFLTMWPAGQPLAATNSLNYTKGVPALSNHVVSGLGTAGQVSVYVSGNGSTAFLFDVQGYIR
jgi:hypothetical protein